MCALFNMLDLNVWYRTTMGIKIRRMNATTLLNAHLLALNHKTRHNSVLTANVCWLCVFFIVKYASIIGDVKCIWYAQQVLYFDYTTKGKIPKKIDNITSMVWRIKCLSNDRFRIPEHIKTICTLCDQMNFTVKTVFLTDESNRLENFIILTFAKPVVKL